MNQPDCSTKRVSQQTFGEGYLRFSLPVKATLQTPEGPKEYQGRLEAIGGDSAQIFLDHPLAQGTEISVLVEFKDKRNREISFCYDAKVISSSCALRYEVDVNLEEGVGISGKDARDILSDLFTETEKDYGSLDN